MKWDCDVGGALPLNEAIPDAPYAGFLEPNPDPILNGLEELPPPPVGGGGLSCNETAAEEGGGGALEATRLVGGVVDR